jgi:hypothetical protein
MWKKIVKSLPPEIPGSRRRFPDIKDMRHVPSDNCIRSSACWLNQQAEERTHFQITEILEADLSVRRLLYLAKTSDPKSEKIMVKFTTKYGRDLHQFCADMECAPKPLAFERLSGGRFGIAIYSVGFLHRQPPLFCENGESWLKEMWSQVVFGRL